MNQWLRLQITACCLVGTSSLHAQVLSEQNIKRDTPHSRAASASLQPPAKEALLPSLNDLTRRGHRLLREEAAATNESDRVAATLEIVELSTALKSDPRLIQSPWLTSMQRTLNRRLRSIKKHLDGQPRHRHGPKRIRVDCAVLGQLAGAAAARGINAGPVGPPTDYGPLLASLIQETISPGSWDVNGGKSTIVYYRPAMALVVRAPKSLHEDVGPLLGALRRE